jgi:hypothetical protein
MLKIGKKATDHPLLYFFDKYPQKNWIISEITCCVNLTVDFIKKHHNVNWNWCDITTNENITMEDIEQNLELSWDFKNITWNNNFTEDIIDKHPYLNWNWLKLLRITSLNFIDKYSDKFDNNLMSNLSENNNLTFNYINNHHNIQWNWVTISENTNITINIIENNPNRPWNYEGLSSNKNITQEYIETNIDEDWNWRLLSNNTNLSLDFFTKYDKLKRGINWSRISSRKDITPTWLNNLILNYPIISTKLSFTYLTYNTNFSIQYMHDNNFDWDWNYVMTNRILNKNDIMIVQQYCNIKLISSNKNFSIDDFKKYDISELNWTDISCNKNILMDDIERNLDLPWNYEYILTNPNLTIEFIENHINEFNDIIEIQYNMFDGKYYEPLQPYLYDRERMNLTINMIKHIKQELLEVTCEPSRVVDWCYSIDEQKRINESMNL